MSDPRRAGVVAGALVIGAVALAALSSLLVPASARTVQAAASPPRVCEALPPGPATAPSGAVSVPAGDNSGANFGTPGATYWFAPGTHTLGGGQYDQIIPGDGATFVGAPGAILDGKGVNAFAFTQHAKNVTIRHLVIQNFKAPQDQGVVNHDSGNNWLIEHNMIQYNSGAAMMAGAGQVVRGNCLRDNGQYALNAYQAGDGITGLVLEGNEISGNATDGEPYPGCGCTGGMKLWATNGSTIRGNWIHHNHGTGVWADQNNRAMSIQDNVVEDNDAYGIFYETSYNAAITGNTFRRNALVEGRKFADRGDRFPIGAIYVSESGYDPRVPGLTSAGFLIEGNAFEDNWGGIIGWENADRYCNSAANTSTGYCTLVGPRLTDCAQPGIAAAPLYSDCRWKTQHLRVRNNTFRMSGAVSCPVGWCGLNGILSNWGTYPDWSPYKGDVIQKAITFDQDNQWTGNLYEGEWRFVVFEPGRVLSFAQWQAAPYGQDGGSTYNGAAPTVPTTATAPPSTSSPAVTTPPSSSTTTTTTTATTRPPATELSCPVVRSPRAGARITCTYK